MGFEIVGTLAPIAWIVHKNAEAEWPEQNGRFGQSVFPLCDRDFVEFPEPRLVVGSHPGRFQFPFVDETRTMKCFIAIFVNGMSTAYNHLHVCFLHRSCSRR